MQPDEEVLSPKKLPLYKQEGFWLAATLGVGGLLIPLGLIVFGPQLEAFLPALAAYEDRPP